MNHVYIATSLDGFIARSDGDIAWLHEVPNPSQSDYGFSDFIDKIDALVMGRHTFEKVLGFGEWPYEKLVFVASQTLAAIPEALAGKAEIVSGSPRELLARIQGLGYESLYIDGGQLIQSFLSEDLIDELTITRIPILLGEGIPLFGGLEMDLKFEHVDTKVYDSALVKSRYRRVSS